jgi:trafficking protein particle complex subunit 11
VQVALTHDAPPYLGEEYPITVEVTNVDDRELEIVVDAMLQPSEVELASKSLRTYWFGNSRISRPLANSISSDRQTWANLIKGVSFGTLATGVSAVKTLYLQSGGAVSDIVIDISVRSFVATAVPTGSQVSPVSPKSPMIPVGDAGETLRTLVVHTVDPLAVTRNVVYRRSTKTPPGLADLATFEAEENVEGCAGEATIVMAWRCVGPHAIKVESAKLMREACRFTTISK